MELITSKENKTIKYIKKLLSSASFRKVERKFVCEGKRLCSDALSSGADILCCCFSESFFEKNTDFCESMNDKAKELFVVRDSIFCAVSETKTPQGVLFVVKTLDKTYDFDKMKKNGKVLALENIGDPSNLGTILRSAEAFGVDLVLLSGNCCDLYSPKVVRGSMGAVFRQPVMIASDFIEAIRDFNDGGRSFAAVLSPDAVSVSDITFTGGCLAAIGNEANGLTKECIEACSEKLYIPMSGGAESLNAAVAASIIVWEMIK